MSLKRILILLGKELIHSSKNFLFIWVVLAPILISLLVSLVFGTLFSEKPKLGVFDQGTSQIVEMLKKLDSLTVKKYESVAGLKVAVEKGVVDLGMVLPPDFDNQVKTGVKTRVSVYVWGESLAKNRIMVGIIIASRVRELSGLENPVIVESITIGEGEAIPWNDRLFPLVVLMAVFLGGLFLPASSIIGEKVKGTIQAIIVTPTSLIDVLFAKGLMGILVSLLMGIIILFLNQAFGAHPWLLILLLFLGGIMAVIIGMISGTFVKDFTTLFAIWKSCGILLFFPAFMYMFPKIPAWLGWFFPTYYLIQPIVELTQKGGGWLDIRTDVFFLIGIDLLILGLLVFLIKVKKPITG